MALSSQPQPVYPQTASNGFMSAHHNPMSMSTGTVAGPSTGYGTTGTTGSTVSPNTTGNVSNTASRMATTATVKSKNIFQRLKGMVYRCAPFLSKTNRMNKRVGTAQPVVSPGGPVVAPSGGSVATY